MTAFTVHNHPVRYRKDPGTPLLLALRDASHLTGTKYGYERSASGTRPLLDLLLSAGLPG